MITAENFRELPTVLPADANVKEQMQPLKDRTEEVETYE